MINYSSNAGLSSSAFRSSYKAYYLDNILSNKYKEYNILNLVLFGNFYKP